MMWISDEHPELDDVRDPVKDIFAEFGIKAVRADEIEHRDAIIERVIQEIRTSENIRRSHG